MSVSFKLRLVLMRQLFKRLCRLRAMNKVNSTTVLSLLSEIIDKFYYHFTFFFLIAYAENGQVLSKSTIRNTNMQ